MIRSGKIGDKVFFDEHGEVVECTITDIGKKYGAPIYCGTDKNGVEHGWYFGPLAETKEEYEEMWMPKINK